MERSTKEDKGKVVEALERAQDAFEERGSGVPDYEKSIEGGGGWKTQLTKACRPIETAGDLREQNGHYTAVIAGVAG